MSDEADKAEGEKPEADAPAPSETGGGKTKKPHRRKFMQVGLGTVLAAGAAIPAIIGIPVRYQQQKKANEALWEAAAGPQTWVARLLREDSEIGLVEAALKHGAHLNAEDDEGNTALHIAAQNGQVKIVKFLLDKKEIKINEQNYDGNTPLHMVTGQSDLGDSASYKIVEALMGKGADVTIKNRFGKTPLEGYDLEGIRTRSEAWEKSVREGYNMELDESGKTLLENLERREQTSPGSQSPFAL